jgi:hypothetical protein
MRWIVAIGACLLALGAADQARAGRQSVLEGPRKLRGFSFESVEFTVPGDWMREPRLQGRVEVLKGGGRDVDVIVLRAADLAAWEKHSAVDTIHAARRARTVDLDVALPGPGRYVLVLSNRFSKVASKALDATALLTWKDDPSLPTGEALRHQVRFLEPVPDAWPITVPVSDDDPALAVVLEREPTAARDSVTVRARRPGAAGSSLPVVGGFTGAIEDLGTVDLHGDGDRDVFIVTSVPAAEGTRRDLILVCPRQRAGLALSLRWPRDAASGAPDVGYSVGYAQAGFSTEQSFLERVMPAYARIAATP